MALPVFPVREARIGDQVFPSDRFRERLELLLLVRRDVEEPAAGLERARRRGREVVVSHRHRLLARDEVIRDDPAHARKRGVEHRDVDERALSVLIRRINALTIAKQR